MQHHRFRRFTLCAVVLVSCWGCGTSGGGGAVTALVPVKGNVTYKGRPLTGGIVHFEPDGYGRYATGKLQSDGTYSLGTNKEGDGVVAGAHVVTIGGFDKSLASDRTLKKYGSRRSSGLTAEVDAEHTKFDFDLK
jgi:hypothetical protein